MTRLRKQLQPVDGQRISPEPPQALQLAALHGLYRLPAALAAAGLPAVSSRAEAARFLRRYAERVCPAELVAARRAFHHAATRQLRELIALDRSLAQVPELRELAGASARMGRGQLAHLLPLRDQRLVARYGETVAAGVAPGHHWVVYGLTLALYSLPLRQGLLDLGRETLAGLAAVSARQLDLPQAGFTEALAAAVDRVPDAIGLALRWESQLADEGVHGSQSG
jgi:urease accessory protein UreF